MNVLIFGKVQYGHQFCSFHEFLNYDLTYLGKYLTNFNEVWHTYSTYRELLSECFPIWLPILQFLFTYLGKYLTDFSVVWHIYSTYRELLSEYLNF